MSDPGPARASCCAQRSRGHLAVVLPADPASPAQARQVLRRVLTEADRLDCLDAAELACTELVTNAVLHAHTAIEVTVDVVDSVRVAVHDGNASLPRHPHYDAQATTGRGLALVAAVTDAYGVTDVGPTGKTVWFTVGGGQRDDTEQELLRAWGAADWDLPGARQAVASDSTAPETTASDSTAPESTAPAVTAPETTAPAPTARDDAGPAITAPDDARAAGPSEPPGGLDDAPGRDATPDGLDQPVLLSGLPASLWLAAAEHHDALLRELVLHVTRHPDDRLDLVGADRARSVLSAAVATAIATTVATTVARPADGAEPAVADDPADRADPASTVDLTLVVRAGAAGDFMALQQALDAAEALAGAGELLARPGRPRVVAVRDWACGQVAAQLAGGAPVAWPALGPGQTHDATGSTAPGTAR
ncbi:ATP-binding protein [uncultured Cellulomonas sp.]|uniref:ATP-binding protein n=1 Tax=uncultured Cellulomonas sp. TaxID=189682 RepID=UPI00262A46C2|nr:ATP-binding protein [uncultured Cellulomonas sp.]